MKRLISIIMIVALIGLAAAIPAEAKRCNAGKSGQHNKHCPAPTVISIPLPAPPRCDGSRICPDQK